LYILLRMRFNIIYNFFENSPDNTAAVLHNQQRLLQQSAPILIDPALRLEKGELPPVDFAHGSPPVFTPFTNPENQKQPLLFPSGLHG